MREVDLAAWVAAETNPDRRGTREALHVLLRAVATSQVLRMKVAMKGGILMAIGYGSSRFTRDIDFSTSQIVQDFNADEFLAHLDDQLALAVQELPYDITCAVQSYEFKPPSPLASFPTLKVRVGFAQSSDEKAIARLRVKQSPKAIPVDLSFNETTFEIETLHIGDGTAIETYTLISLVAEKYRALLQQPIRDRHRGQDVYDLALLIAANRAYLEGNRANLLGAIQLTCQSRGVVASKDSIRDEVVIRLAQEHYAQIEQEVGSASISFDHAFSALAEFYESLPW